MSRFAVDRIQAYALTRTVDGGPVSSLAPMPTRNGLLLRLTTIDGAVGWGEAWCNYPPAGNQAKIMLLRDVIAPTLLTLSITHWREARPELEKLFARMIVHTGEFGPFAHCLSAIDMAMADIAARNANEPLSVHITDNPSDNLAYRVEVYSSTPSVDTLDALIPRLEADGHNCFKLKVGFGTERDLALLSRFRTIAAKTSELCLDANQNWDVPGALNFIAAASAYKPLFIEEPIRADASRASWIELGQASSLPLAAGENITSRQAFATHVEEGSLQVIQPDVAKWGGVSGAIDVGKHATINGATCCLHYMGTALGMAASLHCLSAIGGGGRVELDANPNPLRTDLGDIDLTLRGGSVALPDGPGIGFVPDPSALQDFTVAQCDIRRSGL